MIDFVGLASNGLGAVKEWLGWNRERETRLNEPEIKNNKEANIEAKERDSNERIVFDAQRTGNLDELRKRSSE